MIDLPKDPLSANLRIIKLNILKNDFDWMWVTEGKNRSGKSMFNLNICQEVDPDFSIKKNVAWDIPTFFQHTFRAPKGAAVYLDEGGEVLFSRDAMSRYSRLIIKFFMRAGAKNLFYCIAVPDYRLLDSYVRLHRVSTLVKMRLRFDHEDLLFKRGFYEFYSPDKVSQIFQEQKTRRLHYPYPSFRGRSKDLRGTDLWAEYLEEKQKYLDSKGSEDAAMIKKLEEVKAKQAPQSEGERDGIDEKVE